MQSSLLRNYPAYTLDRDTAPAMWLVGTLWLVMATGIQTRNRCSFLEQVMPGGIGPPAHRHPLAVEGFYVLEGRIAFHIDGRTVRAEEGTLVHIPRATPHTFTVESEETRVLNFYAPAGAEVNIISLARPAEERRRPTMAEGPPPKNPETNETLSRIYGTDGVPELPFNVQPTEDHLKTKAGGWGAGEILVATATTERTFGTFGMIWRLLAGADDTGNDYDLFEVTATKAARMPSRLLNSDEALYVMEGKINADADGEQLNLSAGSFTYANAGSLLGWQAERGSRFLLFHFPGGFDRAVLAARGNDDLLAAHLEGQGHRFVPALPLPASLLGHQT